MTSQATTAGTTLALINPQAGRGRAARDWPALVARVPEIGAVETLVAADAAQARQQLDSRLAVGDLSRLIAVGGDGTAHLAANALLAANHGHDTALAALPAGTGSDFARYLGLPRDPVAALRRIAVATPRPIDAIEITLGEHRHYSLNIASAGLSGAVDERVNRTPRHGGSSYLLPTLQALWSFEPVPCRVDVDGTTVHNGPFFLLAMANGQYFGKGMRVAPEAEIDDGLLDVVLIPPVARWQLPFLLPQFLTGRHIKLERVRTWRARRVDLWPKRGFYPYDVDGETLDAAPAGVRVVPGALRLLA